MAIEKVLEYFKQFDMETKVIQFDKSSATVELAAKALGCQEQRIAKTLSFKLNDEVILIVTAGDARIDNRKFKDRYGAKAVMLDVAEAEERVGHAVGGICPFAVKESIFIYLDESLKRFETVFPACGSSNSAIELTIAELERFSNYADWVDVCKGWNEENT